MFARLERLALALVFVLGSAATGHAVAAADVATLRSKAEAATHYRPGIRGNAPRPFAAATPAYTIHNVGAPAYTGGSLPLGFNNTGQIFGFAYNVHGYTGPIDCVIWTGTVFERLPFPVVTVSTAYHNANTRCMPAGIDDANAATGAYEIVGSVQEEYTFNPNAFAVVAVASAFKKSSIYYPYSPSAMVGVNSAQTSLATAEFSRDTVADIHGQLYFTATGAVDALSQLQAPASPNAPLEHYLIPTVANACPFGGCAINGAGEVLGYDYTTVNDYSTATAALYTLGKPASLVHLPIQDVLGIEQNDNTYQVAVVFPVALNNAGQLVYYDTDLGSPVLYNVASGAKTVISVLPPGCSAPSAAPISLNNLGEVLGVVSNCPNYSGYFTWDSVHGTQFLNAEIPASAYTLFPLGVNDRGQILVTLQTSAGVNDWGTLDPVAGGSAKAQSQRRAGSASPSGRNSSGT